MPSCRHPYSSASARTVCCATSGGIRNKVETDGLHFLFLKGKICSVPDCCAPLALLVLRRALGPPRHPLVDPKARRRMPQRPEAQNSKSRRWDFCSNHPRWPKLRENSNEEAPKTITEDPKGSGEEAPRAQNLQNSNNGFRNFDRIPRHQSNLPRNSQRSNAETNSRGARSPKREDPPEPRSAKEHEQRHNKELEWSRKIFAPCHKKCGTRHPKQCLHRLPRSEPYPSTPLASVLQVPLCCKLLQTHMTGKLH